MSLADELAAIIADQAPEWSDMYLELLLPDEARLLMAPAQLERTAGRRDHFTFRISRATGYGAFPDLAKACLGKLDRAGIEGTLSLLRVVHAARNNITQGSSFWDDHAGATTS